MLPGPAQIVSVDLPGCCHELELSDDGIPMLLLGELIDRLPDPLLLPPLIDHEHLRSISRASPRFQVLDDDKLAEHRDPHNFDGREEDAEPNEVRAAEEEHEQDVEHRVRDLTPQRAHLLLAGT